jgi:hypothetical protein
MQSEKTSVRVFNSVGSLLYEEAFLISSDRFMKAIDLTGMAAGIYYVDIRTKTGLAIKKIIKS